MAALPPSGRQTRNVLSAHQTRPNAVGFTAPRPTGRGGTAMRLKTARVTEFRSVRDSQVFDVGQVTCLVGRNESGKTALLQALYRLNPIVPQRAQFDVTEDYPRSYVKRYERAVKAGDIEPQVVVEAHFALDAEEVSSIEGIFGEGALPTRELVLSKDYANNLTTTLEVNEGLAISHVANKTTLELHVREALLANPTFEQLVQSFVANAQAVNERRTAATAQANALTDAQAKQAALAEANAIQEPSGTKKWREWAEQNKAKTLAGVAALRG